MDVLDLDDPSEDWASILRTVKILAQVRFSKMPELLTPDSQVRLAQLLPAYPVRRQSTAVEFQLGATPGGLQQTLKQMNVMTDQSQTWCLTIDDTAVSLEVSEHVSKDDFLKHLADVLKAVAEVAKPPVVDRVGVRYVCRVQGAEELDRASAAVIPGLRVLWGLVEDGLEVEHSVSDTILRVTPEERIRIRSGVLPAGGMFDPVITPVDEPSWMLDIDAFAESTSFSYNSESLGERFSVYFDHALSCLNHSLKPESAEGAGIS